MKSIAPINRRTENFRREAPCFYLSVSERTPPEYRGLLRYRCLWLSESRTGLSGETRTSAVPLLHHRPHRHAGCTGNGMEKTEPAMRRAYLEEYQEDTSDLDAFLPTRRERLQRQWMTGTACWRFWLI